MIIYDDLGRQEHALDEWDVCTASRYSRFLRAQRSNSVYRYIDVFTRIYPAGASKSKSMCTESTTAHELITSSCIIFPHLEVPGGMHGGKNLRKFCGRTCETFFINIEILWTYTFCICVLHIIVYCQCFSTCLSCVLQKWSQRSPDWTIVGLFSRVLDLEIRSYEVCQGKMEASSAVAWRRGRPVGGFMQQR